MEDERIKKRNLLPCRTLSLCAVTIGADMKVTEKGDVAIMELNGSNAWMEGFRILYGNSLLDERSKLLTAEREKNKEALRWLFCGEHPAYQEKVANNKGPLGDPFNTWNPYGLGILCKDKGSQRWCIPRQYSPPNAVFRGKHETELTSFLDNLRQLDDPYKTGNIAFLDYIHFPYIVTKKSWGVVGGESVCIHSLHDTTGVMNHIEEAQWDCVVEGFVPSRILHHPRTHECHDGAIRLHVDYLIDVAQKTVRTLFEKSYWKLCGVPRECSSSLYDRFVSHTGGYTKELLQSPSKNDHRKAKQALDSTIEALLSLDPTMFEHVESERALL